MKIIHRVKKAAWALIILILLGCSTVSITQRRQLTLIPQGEILTLSLDQYKQFIAEHDVITGTEQAAMVKRVGKRIRSAVERYMRSQGDAEALKSYRWEFNLIDDDSVNAFAMPGGKVVVFSGILPVAQNDTGLAVVLGHEIAHVVARHGNERMSQALVAQLGGAALDIALADQPQATRQLFMQAYGMGSQVGLLLPYSRLQESEADQLGLVFMAMAGYDPRSAVAFWQRMDARAKGGAPPEFLSTHPSHQTRIQDIRDHLPEALKYYRPRK